MDQEAIFAPMGAMALLTFTVLLLVPIARFRAAFAGQVTVDDFKLGESQSVPANVSLPNRNYMNLLELPTLFFPACLMFYVTHHVTAAAIDLAWVFVALRLTHSLIHVSYNNVRHRLVAFTLGNGALGALWVMFFVHKAA